MVNHDKVVCDHNLSKIMISCLIVSFKSDFRILRSVDSGVQGSDDVVVNTRSESIGYAT
uniref:Uncharacterized protein n=1 Tax=Anguilla anguilla TaxID=7936 RepID=A0A0E9Q303_ANGAN